MRMQNVRAQHESGATIHEKQMVSQSEIRLLWTVNTNIDNARDRHSSD